MLVGGYSHWSPESPVLSKEQEARVKELKAQLTALDKESAAMAKAMLAAAQGLDGEEAAKKREEVVASQKDARVALSKKRTEIMKELEPLTPGAKRVSYVWLYENTTNPGLSAGASDPVGDR
jgi:hypothetical protein